MILLEQTITEYSAEHHPDWELIPSSLTSIFKTIIANRTNHSPHRIVIDDHHITIEHYNIYHDSHRTEPWTHHTVLNKIETAISNIPIDYNQCYDR